MIAALVTIVCLSCVLVLGSFVAAMLSDHWDRVRLALLGQSAASVPQHVLAPVKLRTRARPQHVLQGPAEWRAAA